MPDNRRIKRLEQVILQTVAPLVSHGLADPRLGMVTVTRIGLSRDLGIARVNWSCLGTDAERSRAARALEHARGYLQSAVARAMKTRTTPHLEFHYDGSMERAARVQEILGVLARERGGDEDGGESADAPESVTPQGTEPETPDDA